jgi:dephospho-CoA kinase
MVVLGVTGGIASGKSTVGRLLQARGAFIIDADQVARELLAPGQELTEKVIGAFGEAVKRPGGGLDRAAVARIIFADREARERLNRITHPPVIAEIEKRIKRVLRSPARPPVVAVIAPLLFEAGVEGLVDKVLVVTAEETEQIRRLRERDGLSEAEARQRIAAQMSTEEKRLRGDWAVDTTRGEVVTETAVDAVWRELVGSGPAIATS